MIFFLNSPIFVEFKCSTSSAVLPRNKSKSSRTVSTLSGKLSKPDNVKLLAEKYHAMLSVAKIIITIIKIISIAKEHPSPGEDLFLEQQQVLAQHQTNPNKIIATVKNNPTPNDTTKFGLDSSIFFQFSAALSPFIKMSSADEGSSIS